MRSGLELPVRRDLRADQVARWRYDIEPTETGCRATESWQDQRPTFFARATSLITGVGDRVSHNEAGMVATLEALARTAESET
ncbi:MAG: hypothetical protein R2716_02380 [Microthrixaceae bacterium]